MRSLREPLDDLTELALLIWREEDGYVELATNS